MVKTSESGALCCAITYISCTPGRGISLQTQVSGLRQWQNAKNIAINKFVIIAYKLQRFAAVCVAND
jgi:hypothetical protein